MLVLIPCYNMRMKQKFGSLAILSTALLVPLAIFAGSSVEYILKRTNPDHVDITLGLAYLRPMLASGIGVAVALTICSITLALMGLKKDENRRLAKFSLILLSVILLSAVASGVLKHQSDTLENAQTKSQVQDLFKTLGR